MYKILIVNPVGTNRWDEEDLKIYKSFADPDIEVFVKSLPKGPETVETLDAYIEAEKETIKFVLENYRYYNGVIVNCFLDPGVEILRRRIGKEIIIIGPAEASLSYARFYGNIGILTVGAYEESIELIKTRIRSLGFDKKVMSIRGIPMGVIDLDKDRDKTLDLMIREAKKMYLENIDVIVLGCTGLAGLAKSLEEKIGIPVIDPAWATIKMMKTILTR
jgi:allantoin racemase